jgi:hypothetical protein
MQKNGIQATRQYIRFHPIGNFIKISYLNCCPFGKFGVLVIMKLFRKSINMSS